MTSTSSHLVKVIMVITWLLSIMVIYGSLVILAEIGFVDIPFDQLGKNLVNYPTRSVLISFLVNDTTNENLYNQSYDCKDYAVDLKNNAEDLGYRIRPYTISGENLMGEYNTLLLKYYNVSMTGPGIGHVVCKAYIMDEGLWVTIEPQGDLILNCTIGGR